MNGWIKLHRKILENEQLMHDDNAFLMFTKLLLVANKNNGKYTTGRYRLAELCNMKPSTARDTLYRLRNYKMTTLEPDNKKTIITICNWSKYQGSTDTKPDNQTTSRRHLDDTKQEVRIKNKENTNVLAKANYGNPVINKMFGYWNNEVGYAITSKLQANRRACNNLLKKHGEAGLEKLIKGVAVSSDDQYAPRIADFTELQSKLNSLILWGKKQSNNKIGVIK